MACDFVVLYQKTKMAEKEENATTRDWEVVSLTASAYAASPGPKQVEDLKEDNQVTRYEAAETSHPLYMSRHFVFPTSEKEPEIHDEDDKLSNQKKKIEDLMTTGLEFYEEKKSKEEDIYKTAINDERAIGGSHVYEYEQNQPIEPVTVVTSPTKAEKKKDDDDEEANADNNATPPCEASWWKRSAASLISQAKETNTVWSIFVAAAVMGIVILGQRWQHERWQILQHKWESSIANEKGGRLIGPISRLKQAFIGGQRRGSFIRVSSQNDS